MAERFRSKTVRRVLRNRFHLWGSASPILVGLALATFGIVSGTWPLVLPLAHLGILGSVLVAWAYKRNANPSYVGSEVSVDDEAVRVDGEVVVRREEITQGFVVKHEGKAMVRLGRRGLRPSVLLAAKDRDEARRLLVELGLDATQTAAELRALSGVMALPLAKQLAVMLLPFFVLMIAGIATSAALAPSLGPAPMLGGIGMAVTWILGLVFSPTTVRIGVDGVVLRWLGRERFVPFADVTRLERYELEQGNKTYIGLTLHLRDGREVKVPTGQKNWNEADASELEERMRQALELHRRAASGVDPRLLARGGRDVSTWVTELRRLGSGARADARTGAVPLDRILGVVDDPSAPAALRAGAALAAVENDPEQSRERVRIAADTTASPRLRVALETIASAAPDDAAIGEALAALEAEDAKAG